MIPLVMELSMAFQNSPRRSGYVPPDAIGIPVISSVGTIRDLS